MQLLLGSDFSARGPAHGEERAYRESPRGAVAAEAVALAAGLVLGAVAVSSHGALGGLVFLPGLAIAARLARAARSRPSDALGILRHRPDGLAVPIAPPEPSPPGGPGGPGADRAPRVLWIASEEIAGVRAALFAREVPSLRGECGVVDVRQRCEHLEILLRPRRGDEASGAELRALRTLLERSPATPGRVSLSAPDVIAIPWRVPGHRASVSIERALAELGTSLEVLQPRRAPARAWSRLRGRDLDDFVRELVESGDASAASEILRLRHGWTSSRARRFVRALLGRAA